MSTKQYNRPDTATPVDGETGLTNRDKFQVKSATIPKIPISSEDHDSEFNYLIDAVNELYDTALSGTVPDNSITLAKLSHLGNGSIYIMSATGVPTELTVGSSGDVLTIAGGAASWAAPSAIPTGTLAPYGGTTAPTGYIFADGSVVSRSTYSALFAVFSTNYGAGDGSTTFGLPDLRGIVPVGKDNMGGTSANNITSTQADVLGGNFGSESHTLTTSEIPAHTHTYDKTSLTYNAAGGGTTVGQTITGTASGSTGGGSSHNNVQPSIFLNYIIKT